MYRPCPARVGSRTLWLTLLVGCLLGARLHAADPAPQQPLSFGVYTHIRSTEMHRKMAPLQTYLQRALAERGVRTEVDLRIFPSYTSAIDALAQGQVDFVRYGPVSYVLAKERNPDLRLLAMESNGGSKSFNGVISVPADSPIQSVAELRGKRIASGRYLAQAALLAAGISAQDLAGYSYLGRHDKVAFAVAAGNYDAGATNENTFNKYAAEKGLRKLLEFPCVTKPWVAREGLPDMIFEALRDALLTLKDPAVLEHIVRDGLLPAQDSDYDEIRRAMAQAGHFDPASLSFGVYAAIKPSDSFNQVRPAVAMLERELTTAGSLSSLRIRVLRDYRELIDALGRGDIDFARLGPASYVLARERYPEIRLLARERSAGPAPAGVFVVPADSDLESIQQLAGRRLAFGDIYSTEGRYLAQAELLTTGIRAADLAGFSYLGRHDRVAHAVARGNYDAGALRESVFQSYDGDRPLRVIGRFESAHKLWVARAGLDPQKVADLRQGLQDIPPGPALAPLSIDGFESAASDDAGCARLRRQMQVARKFDPRP